MFRNLEEKNEISSVSKKVCCTNMWRNWVATSGIDRKCCTDEYKLSGIFGRIRDFVKLR